MKTSETGLDLIKKYEGLYLKAYRCPAGVWTVGYGSTRGVRPWTVITRAQAEQRLREDIQTAEQMVDQVYYLQKKLKQNQYDALVSLTFNIGTTAFCRSTLRKKVLNNPEDRQIRQEFERWIYAGGKPLQGLIARRAEEADLYFTES